MPLITATRNFAIGVLLCCITSKDPIPTRSRPAADSIWARRTRVNLLNIAGRGTDDGPRHRNYICHYPYTEIIQALGAPYSVLCPIVCVQRPRRRGTKDARKRNRLQSLLSTVHCRSRF